MSQRQEDHKFKANDDKVSKTLSQKQNTSQAWWLTPVIPATLEAKIKRIII
jgi:hypothetical protein